MHGPVAARLEDKIHHEPNSGCWLWGGRLNNHGYGVMYPGAQGGSTLAHRISFEVHRGPVPRGLELDHLCRVRCCVNPAHLEPVTRSTNVRRGLGPSRQTSKTHCPFGHEYAPGNIVTTKLRKRSCKECHRRVNNAYAARIRAERVFQ